MIAIMLIFNPSASATWVLAGVLVFLLSCVCAHFAIHVLAQFLKGSAADMEESEDEEPSGSPEAKQNKEKMRAAAAAKQNPLLRFVGSDLACETGERRNLVGVPLYVSPIL